MGINLLPEESKTRTGGGGASKISLDPRYFINLIPFIFAAVILVHVCLAGVLLVRNIELGSLNSRWEKLRPQRESAADLNKKFESLTSNSKLIQELDNRKLSWSDKLTRLSRNLPSGIWFNEMLISRKELALKGSAVSLQKQEMSIIKKFLDALKSDAGFLKNFSSIELGSLQKKSIGSYDVVDFVLVARLKTR